MDFIDWRKAPDKIKTSSEAGPSTANKSPGKHFRHYVEELIQQAQERGDFDNLEGTGKPLHLEDDSAAGDMAMAYHILKSNGFAPAEVELAREIRTERERAETKIAGIIHQGKTLRSRRVHPFVSQKRAFNAAVQNAATEYERTLRELNRKILTMNLTTPVAMHQSFLEVERLVQDFRDACPLFEDEVSQR